MPEEAMTIELRLEAQKMYAALAESAAKMDAFAAAAVSQFSKIDVAAGRSAKAIISASASAQEAHNRERAILQARISDNESLAKSLEKTYRLQDEKRSLERKGVVNAGGMVQDTEGMRADLERIEAVRQAERSAHAELVAHQDETQRMIQEKLNYELRASELIAKAQQQAQQQAMSKAGSAAGAMNESQSSLDILRAKLAGNTQLVESLERQLQLDREIAKLLAAGVSHQQAQAQAQSKVQASQQLAQQQAQQQAQQSIKEHQTEQGILSARLAGNEKLAKSLEHQRDIEREINALISAGVDKKNAATVATQTVNQRAALSAQNNNRSSASSGASSGGAGWKTGQVSMQVQDIAVQAQMGAKTSTIIAQQGSQLLSIFGGSSGRGALYGGILAVGAGMVSLGQSADEAFAKMMDGAKRSLMDFKNLEGEGIEAAGRGIKELKARGEEMSGQTVGWATGIGQVWSSWVEGRSAEEDSKKRFEEVTAASKEMADQISKANKAAPGISKEETEMAKYKVIGAEREIAITTELLRLKKEMIKIEASGYDIPVKKALKAEADVRSKIIQSGINRKEDLKDREQKIEADDISEQGHGGRDDMTPELVKAKAVYAEKRKILEEDIASGRTDLKKQQMAVGSAAIALESAKKSSFTEASSLKIAEDMSKVKGTADAKRMMALKAEHSALEGMQRLQSNEMDKRKTGVAMIKNEEEQIAILHERTFKQSSRQIHARLNAEEKARKEEEKWKKKQTENKGLIDLHRDGSGTVIGGKDPVTGERLNKDQINRRDFKVEPRQNGDKNVVISDASIAKLVASITALITK